MKVLGNNLLVTEKVLGNKILCPSMSSVTILGKQKQSSSSNSHVDATHLIYSCMLPVLPSTPRSNKQHHMHSWMANPVRPLCVLENGDFSNCYTTINKKSFTSFSDPPSRPKAQLNPCLYSWCWNYGTSTDVYVYTRWECDYTLTWVRLIPLSCGILVICGFEFSLLFYVCISSHDPSSRTSTCTLSTSRWVISFLLERCESWLPDTEMFILNWQKINVDLDSGHCGEGLGPGARPITSLHGHFKLNCP